MELCEKWKKCFCKTNFEKSKQDLLRSKNCGDYICYDCIKDCYNRVINENLKGLHCVMEGDTFCSLKEAQNFIRNKEVKEKPNMNLKEIPPSKQKKINILKRFFSFSWIKKLEK